MGRFNFFLMMGRAEAWVIKVICNSQIVVDTMV